MSKLIVGKIDFYGVIFVFGWKWNVRNIFICKLVYEYECFNIMFILRDWISKFFILFSFLKIVCKC